MIIQKWVQDEINKIASDKNLPIKTIYEIAVSQFEYTRNEIRSSEQGKPSTYKNILLKYFGTFSFNYKKDFAIARRKGDDISEFEKIDKWKPVDYEKLNRKLQQE